MRTSLISYCLILILSALSFEDARAQEQPQQDCLEDRLIQSIAGMRGSAQVILKLTEEKNQKIERVLQMVHNGQIEAAKYLSKQWCLNIPESIFSESATRLPIHKNTEIPKHKKTPIEKKMQTSKGNPYKNLAPTGSQFDWIAKISDEDWDSYMSEKNAPDGQTLQNK